MTGTDAPSEGNADTCASKGALIAAMPAGIVHSEVESVTWQFTAPAGETIAAATLWRAGDVEGGAGYLFWLAAPDNPAPGSVELNQDLFDGCAYVTSCTKAGTEAEPLAEQNRVTVPSENLGGSHLYINAGCSRLSCPNEGGDPAGLAAVVYLYAAAIELEDDAAPTASELSGPLDSAASLSGTESLDFHAADVGSGVAKTAVKVDGKTVSEAPVEPYDTHCKPLETRGGMPVYLYAQPCPASVAAHVSLNTAAFADGAHQLTVEAVDAAGNRTVVLERSIEIANPTAGAPPSNTQTGEATAAPPPPAAIPSDPPAEVPNGQPASSHAKLLARWQPPEHARRRARASARRARTSITAPFGRRHRIVGRLTTDTGAPIAHAVVRVTATPSFGGARPSAMRPSHTDAQGRFAIRLPPNTSSRTILISYAYEVGGSPVARARLKLTVHAAIRLRVRPRRTGLGGTITLSGQLRGGPIPPGGKQIVLEARAGGTGWLQFATLHTNARGHFHLRHRFQLPGPIRYRFRAISPHEADYPFAAGASNVVAVFER